MPHINRIRVNNVRYNFGTQFYDDFMMRFDGRNALYDLANGGGKSVLLLLMMQNMIPNCSLDDKQPLEKLFRGPDGSTVIHSLIEWQLDDYLVRDGFRYMLTGFCARKTKADEEEDKSSAAIEYFNYVIFYRGSNDYDIANLPLEKDGQRVTFAGLKNDLKNLSRSAFQVKARVFERKGQYQQFISRYGLYESEWEIIRGINRTEGHVRAYFENNYKTTRKVVEDLLIESVIQKAFMTQTAGPDDAAPEAGDSGEMAENLYLIRDELSRLMQKRQTLDQYDRQKQALEIIRSRTQQLDPYYRAAAAFTADFSRIHRTAALQSRKRTLSLSVAKKEMEAAADKIETLTCRIEMVKLQSENARLENMRSKIRTMENDCMEIRQSLKMLQDDLRLRECMNDYLDCLAAEQQRKAVLESLRFSEKDHEGLLTETAGYAAEWEKRCRAKAAALDEKIEAEDARRQQLKETLDGLENTERELDRALAVAAHQITEKEAQQKKAQQHFDALKAEAGILLIEQVHAGIREEAEKITAAEKEKGMLDAADEALRQRLEEIAGLLQENSTRAALLEKELKDQEAALSAAEKEKAGIEKLCAVYHAGDAGNLREIITARYHKLIGENIRMLEARTSASRHLAALDEGMLSVADEPVRQLMNTLRTRCRSVCVYGAEYLKGLDPEEAGKCLERLPFLPDAVIVKGSLENITGVLDDPEIYLPGRRIPVVALEAVTSDAAAFDASMVRFAGRVPSDDEAVCQLRTYLEQTREKQSVRLTRMNDELRTYAADLEAVTVYLHQTGQDLDQQKVLLDALKADIHEAGMRRQALQAEEARIRDELAAHVKRCGELEVQADAAKNKQALLQALKEESLALDTLGDELTAAAGSREQQLRGRLETKSRLAAARTALEKTEEGLRALRQNQQTLLDDFEANWRIYVRETPDQTAGGVWEILDDDQLLAALEGAKAACEQTGGDLTDKQLLMESYAAAAERMRKAIEGRGIAVDRLQEMRDHDELIRTDETALKDLKKMIAGKEENLTGAQNTLEKNQARMYELSGSVSQAMRAAQARFGQLKAVDLRHQDPQDDIARTKELLAATRETLAAAEDKVQRLSKETWQLENMVRDFGRMMQVYQVTPDECTDTYDLKDNLKDKFDALPDQAQRLRRMKEKCRDDFDRDRALTIRELETLGAHGLAESLKEQVAFPEDAAAADALMLNINETIHLIALEKEHAASGVDQLLQIKKHFEDQCLQICLNIRTELDKLPKMSVITMDNERIQMVGLRIPYISEDLYSQRMSDYIDDIVRSADRLPTREEKMALIRSRLTWKRLFAVIVTDMNAIRLTLYKRERVREQSRYLKYEEAVGSTGQSQGIYIQFLIAIIHYISSIHAGAIKGVLKKTIFIDNPFGAAKDIYIWEPIFQLLKTNHVQLIVPARGTSPAITGRFDVNYVLDQRMMDRGLQTIVSDFSSNVVVEDLDYEKIDYEQLSLFD